MRRTIEAPAWLEDEDVFSVPFPLPPEHAEVVQHPNRAAASAAELEPCGGTFDAVLGVRYDRVSDAGLLNLLHASERHLAAMHARQVELLAELARRDPEGEAFLRDEAALALKAAPVTTNLRIKAAVQLTGRLWDTHECCRAGDLSGLHARILSDTVADLTDEVTAKVQRLVLKRACAQTPGEFRASVRKAVAKYDTRQVEQKHKDAFAKRRVGHGPLEDGMAEVYAVLGADGAAALMAAINAAASVKAPGDSRTAGQRRADALVDLAHAALCDPSLPTAHGARPAINITVGLATLLGCSDAPGELDGYGPIPAAMARRIADDPTGTWRRLITDSAGRLLDYQDTVYKPPAALARHVIHRDGRCVVPGCRRKAHLCELDHRVPYPPPPATPSSAGGPPLGSTNAENLEALCPRHHRMKHRHGTRVSKDPDGSYRWTTPTGRRYRYIPETLPPPQPEPDPTAQDPIRGPADDLPPF